MAADDDSLEVPELDGRQGGGQEIGSPAEPVAVPIAISDLHDALISGDYEVPGGEFSA